MIMKSTQTLQIALTGKLRSGKDVVANYLMEYYGFAKFAFGNALKRYAHEIFGDFNGKPRKLYQTFGQLMRQIDSDIWVKKCFEEIERYRKQANLIGMDVLLVITDLRQPNEYEKCKREGFKIIRVNCDDDIRLKRAIQQGDIFNEEDFYHETETYISQFDVDFEIWNNSTLDVLYKQVDTIMKQLNIKAM